MAFAKIPPMTSRQAKKAYRQASGPRLSAAEQRRIERNAVLLEREQKAKEKERNRIANKKKRLEKEEKAKEQRKSMGVIEEGYVSPRQVRLGAYFGKVIERDEDEQCSKRDKLTGKNRGLPRPCLEESVAVAEGSARNFAPGTLSYLPPQDFNFSDNDWASFLPTNTQVERELSEGITIAEAFAAVEDPAQPGSSHSEHFASREAITSACEPQRNTSRQQEDLAQIPPFSTQDLEFSTDELTELMTPARIPEALLGPKSTSSTRCLNPLSSADDRANLAFHAGQIDDGKHSTSIKGPTKKVATPVDQEMTSRHSQYAITSKQAVSSRPPEVDDHITRPSTYPEVTRPSTTKSYVLADREVVPGHAKYVLDRVLKTVSTKKIPKKVFGNPIANAMRPPNKKTLGNSSGNANRVARNMLVVTSSEGESKDTTQQPSENRYPIDVKTPSASFDFGDSFSTQELLDYVV
ncbi:hypothetical protein MMC18_002820 [Xylographa bjoerkii]|nr:hypothetical protein [Xylographa bjoerkii]